MGVRRAVVGIGNPLRTDDGVGPAVVATLQESGGAEDWHLVVLENDLAGLGPLLFTHQEVIVVDAVAGAGQPGTALLAPWADSMFKRQRPVSLHDLELAAEVALARAQGVWAAVRLFGIVPFSLAYGIGLTLGMRAALPGIVERLREVLHTEV